MLGIKPIAEDALALKNEYIATRVNGSDVYKALHGMDNAHLNLNQFKTNCNLNYSFNLGTELFLNRKYKNTTVKCH